MKYIKKGSVFLLILVLPIINIKYGIVDLRALTYDDFQSNMFTVSSVFMGFSVSTLGILLSLYSNEVVQKVSETGILLKKVNKFTKSLLYMGISMIIFLLSILKIIDYFDTLCKGICEYFSFLSIMSFLIGLVYYLMGSYDLIKILKILYGENIEQNKKIVDDFEKSLKKK